MRRPTLCAVLLLLAFLISPASTMGAGQQANPEVLPLRFTANAQALGAAISGMARVEILLTRWSTPEEGATLEGIFLEQGQGAMVDALQKMPEVGRFRVGTELSYPLQFAEAVKTEDGWMVFIATDREIGAYEAYYQARTLDHSLGLVQLMLDDEGNGEGTVAPAVKLIFNRDANTLVIEDWDTRPVRLRRVRIRE